MFLIFLIFLILSILLLSGRGSFLIAGYNTSIPKEKAKYDEKKLCRVTGAGLLIITILMGIMLLLDDDIIDTFAKVFAALTLTDIGVMLYVMNKKCYIKDWDGKVPEMTEEEKRKHRILTRVCIGVCVVVVILVGIFLMTGNIDVQYDVESFTIEADYWSDKTISYADIEQLEFREGNDPGNRISGFGSFRLEMGSFRNVEFGTYTRYTYTQCDAVVVLKVAGQYVVLNGMPLQKVGSHWILDLQRRNRKKKL